MLSVPSVLGVALLAVGVASRGVGYSKVPSHQNHAASHVANHANHAASHGISHGAANWNTTGALPVKNVSVALRPGEQKDSTMTTLASYNLSSTFEDKVMLDV